MQLPFAPAIWQRIRKFLKEKINRLRLPRLISDGMVLQRDTPVKIWGWTRAGRKVTLRFNGCTYCVKTGKDGKWSVLVSPVKAGGPYTMEIISGKRLTIEDILAGEVWVCSGQSNMGLPISRVKELYPDVIANSENPHIREFKVADRYDFTTAQDDLTSGSWVAAAPGTVPAFAAAGYFFAAALFEKYRVPVGFINASIGGSSINAWMSETALKAFPAHLASVEKLRDKAYLSRLVEEDTVKVEAWYKHLERLDNGLAQPGKKWFETDYDASAWQTIQLPACWQDAGLPRLNGVVWFRKEIEIPAAMTGQPAKLYLGRIIDSDTVYVNGKFAGATAYQYPPRIYELPGDLLMQGKNIITVRVISNCGDGAFTRGKPYCLKAGGQTLDLTGIWHYRIGATTHPLPSTLALPNQSLGLFNGMLAPLTDYTVKGVNWYQGESNTGNVPEYKKLFPALIADWRNQWQRGDLPFLFVQLPNYGLSQDNPAESAWAELRETQRITLSVPHTAMVVAVDTGEWHDLHPLNKKDIGRRLALAAQKTAYGEDNLVFSGPLYHSIKIDGSRIIISFLHTGSGLMIKGGGELKHFAIAGSDKKFSWAQAKIENDKVVVWSNAVSNPVAVRYAWADNPQDANLYNKEGLPASPFTSEEEFP